jgi:hypothetical protein
MARVDLCTANNTNCKQPLSSKCTLHNVVCLDELSTVRFVTKHEMHNMRKIYNTYIDPGEHWWKELAGTKPRCVVRSSDTKQTSGRESHKTKG